MLIDLAETSKRFDSIVEANDKGDSKALRAAIESNISVVGECIRSAENVIRRYGPTLNGLLVDLSKLD
jgi:hypothetical protein